MKDSTALAAAPTAIGAANSALIAPSTGLSIFDSGAFERLYQIAEALASSSLVPETLREYKGEPLPHEKVVANCLRVVEQAARWKLSPFAVLDCASVVHGRLMWEGKLIAAVIEASLGIRLDYEYSGSGDGKRVVVYGRFADEPKPRTVEGTVGQWKTTGRNSPWESPNNHERQLAYRGAREWARRHAPGVILGVYTPDEFEPEEMRDATPRRAIARDIPIDPAEIGTTALVNAEEGPGESHQPPASEPKPDPLPPNPSTTPAAGRQKRDRVHRDGRFRSIVERKSTDGTKRFWVTTWDIGEKSVELTTFSESIATALAIVDKGQACKLTIVGNSQGGFGLEDYAIIEAREEGGLL